MKAKLILVLQLFLALGILAQSENAITKDFKIDAFKDSTSGWSSRGLWSQVQLLAMGFG